jgi:Na+-translocating ferredoxin:NAD+ oxidoreductase RnfE subunit
MPWRDRDNPLFFKRDGGLALGQFFLGVLIVWVCCIFTAVGLGRLTYDVAAWTFLGSFVTLFFIAYANHDRAELIAARKDVAQSATPSAPTRPLQEGE